MKIKIINNWNYKKIIWTKYFIITDKFIFQLKIYWKFYLIIVPEWFITDLGSIPSIFFFFDKSRYISYILHDYLYSLIWKIENINWKLNYNQELVDNILIAWLNTEWMNDRWKIFILIWLSIWWRFNYKKEDKEISKLKKDFIL